MTPSKRKGVRVEAADEPTEMQTRDSPWDNASLSEEHTTTEEPYVDDAPSVNPTNQHRIPARPQPTVGTQNPPPVTDDAYLEPGTILGEYRVEAQIGEGGMGVVYSAAHPLIGKRAAIKVLKAELCRSHFNVERFIDEARIVNQIGHPNIVDVFAFGNTADGRSYFVMEWLKGESLRDRVARTRLDLDEICDVIRPLARALEAAHEQGVIHRDLKPDNIFLVEVRGEAPLVKLLDFGIAKLAREEHRMERTATGAMVGTPQYIAPEQAKGYTIDARVDIYALGGILFELVTGRPPFVADNAMEMVAKHLMEPPPRPSAFTYTPPELDDLVVRMLAKDPAGRPTLAEVATVIERTSALDRTNVKTPLPPPVASKPIEVPTPTPGSMPNLAQLAAAAGQSNPSLVQAGVNPSLSAAVAKAMATPNTLSDTVDATEMTETIRATGSRGLSKRAIIILLSTAFAIALATAFIIVRSAKSTEVDATAAEVLQPEPPQVQPLHAQPHVDPPPPPPTVEPIQEPPTPAPTATVEPVVEPEPKEPQPSATKVVEPPAKKVPHKVTKTVKAPSPPKKREGRLELSISGGNAPQIMIGGKRHGPGAVLPAGTHSVTITDKGYKTLTFTVKIEDGEVERKTVVLEPKKTPKPEDLMQPGSLDGDKK